MYNEKIQRDEISAAVLKLIMDRMNICPGSYEKFQVEVKDIIWRMVSGMVRSVYKDMISQKRKQLCTNHKWSNAMCSRCGMMLHEYNDRKRDAGKKDE